MRFSQDENDLSPIFLGSGALYEASFEASFESVFTDYSSSAVVLVINN